MFIKIEKLLNSLQYHVDKNIDETLHVNKTYLSSKWNLFEYNVLRWSKKNNYYILLIWIAASLFITNLLMWKEILTPFAIKHFPHWGKLIDWQDGFLAGQLTIVGAVYPLVIGLIGVLFQNKSAKKVLFPIYQIYSGFMFAGLSGLYLSIFIIVGYFLRAIISESTYLAFCITTALWLVFNILLTCWFFISTFLMLDEEKRDRLIVRFTIHELCEIDIRHRIGDLLLLNAIKNKLLITPNDDILKVSTYEFHDENLSEITSFSSVNVHITNIYFRIINCIILYQYNKIRFLLWARRYYFGRWLISRIRDSSSYLEPNTTRKLVIQPIYTKKNGSHLVVVRYSGINLGWLSKKLIRFSIITEKNNEKSLTSMMLGLVGTTNDAIREKNISEFKYAISNVVKWHIEIASALSFLNDNGNEDNWLLLPQVSFFSRNYLDEIMSQYYEVASSAVELIPENINFFNEVIYLHRRIFIGRDKLVDREGLLLIQGSYYTWSLLMEWRSYSSSSADMRIANKYEDVLFAFVGAWESWLDYFNLSKVGIDDLAKQLPFTITHLEYTANTIISAIRYENIEAAGWGVDMLNSWYDKLSATFYDNSHAEYIWNSELITHNILSEDIKTQLWNMILNNHPFNFQSAFYIAFKNASFDIRVITACYILIKPNRKDDIKLRNFIHALLSGSPIHPTGSINNTPKSIDNAADILITFIRHRDYKNHDNNSYGAWLSKVLELFGRVNETRRVSGRIYSGWGRNDIHSLSIAYVEIAISLSNNQWQLGSNHYNTIFSEIFRHQDKESIVRDLKEWINLSDEIKNPFLISKEDFQNNIDNFKFSINQVISKINEQKSKAIANAEIDNERLECLSLICSGAMRNSADDIGFPISLFKSVKFNSERLEKNKLKINITNYLKEYIAKGVNSNETSFGDTQLKELTENDIKLNILRKILRYSFSEEKSYGNIEDHIVDISRNSGGIVKPILLSANQELNSFLFKTRYQKEQTDKLGISFIDGYGRNYICHIGDTIVYSIHFSDVNFSILTSIELFDSIEFGKVNDVKCVDVIYEPSEIENVGCLSINYWMQVDLPKGMPFIKAKISY